MVGASSRVVAASFHLIQFLFIQELLVHFTEHLFERQPRVVCGDLPIIDSVFVEMDDVDGVNHFVDNLLNGVGSFDTRYAPRAVNSTQFSILWKYMTRCCDVPLPSLKSLLFSCCSCLEIFFQNVRGGIREGLSMIS